MSQVLQESRQWVENFVIRLGLCPFAAKPFEEDRLRFVEGQSDDFDALLRQLLGEVLHLTEQPVATLSTTLFVCPRGLSDFMDFLDFVETIQSLLQEAKADEYVQLAHFHPDYQFKGTEPSDPANRTNRSPYPMVQLLRVDEVSKAIEQYPDVEGIPARNMALLRGDKI